MALNLDPRNPRTAYLGGGRGPGGGQGFTPIDDKVVTGTPKPGYLVEVFDDGGVAKYRAHSVAAGTFAAKSFLIERLYHNQGIEDPYADGEQALVYDCYPGAVIYAVVPSGQDIVAGNPLESNGDGKLKEGTTYPVARALESPGAVTADTRIRAEVL